MWYIQLMYRFLHIFVITCLLSLGLAEASERVMPEPNGAVDVVAGEQHTHHDSSLEHDSESDTELEHCADCCHAPCFWIASGDFKLPLDAGKMLVRSSLARRFSSERPPMLFRPPIA